MTALYSENDPRTAAWLSNLIAAGKLEPGRIDARDMRLLAPDEVPARAHFFAGIGGWPLALDMAGFPRAAEVWTGSCPCQPFSAAGRKKGFDDDRHLWPDWFKLIRARRPALVLGEQVASPDGLRWLDAVLADLEGAGYACRAADLCAAGAGAPHIRQRLYFVAVADGERLEGLRLQLRERAARPALPEAGRGGEADVAVPAGFWDDAEWIACRDGKLRPVEPGTFPLAHGVPGRVVKLRGYGNAVCVPLAATFVKTVIECLL